MRRGIVLTVAALLALAACSSGGGNGDGSTATSPPAAGSATPAAVASAEVGLAAVAADVIVPRYQAFATEADELVTAVEGLCASPGPAALEAAQAQWGATRAAWRRTLAFGFGPAMDLRTMSDVDFGTSAGKVEDVVAGTEPVAAEAVGQLGANARGLGAIEQLLFGEDAGTLTATTGARRCQYAAAASTLVATAADEALAGWTSGSEPYAATLDDDAQASLNDIFNEVIRTLQGVADQKLATALGDRTGAPEPEVADPGPAHRALDDMLDDLDGVMASYEAVLEPRIARQSADAASRTRAELTAGIEALAAVTGPLTAAVVDDRDGLTAAQEQLKTAKRTLATEVASLLGLTLTFSDADGDS
jgi:predicted lipoprotein